MNDQFKFSTDIDIRINEINYGGHLGNEQFLALFQEARLRYLKQFDCSELSIGNDTSLIMSQAHINFKAEAFWGERLKVFVRIATINKIRFKIEYQIKEEEKRQVEIANGHTEMIGFDYKKRKIKRLPQDFIKSIKEYENI